MTRVVIVWVVVVSCAAGMVIRASTAPVRLGTIDMPDLQPRETRTPQWLRVAPERVEAMARHEWLPPAALSVADAPAPAVEVRRPELHYLGAFIEPDRAYALIVYRGQKRLMRTGEVIGGGEDTLRVIAADRDHVIVSYGEQEFRINRSGDVSRSAADRAIATRDVDEP